MKIALFDMDGVLLVSAGYHRALQDTVKMTAQSLGFPDTTLTQDEIAAFESTGMTSEWDEAAVSLALFQLEAWRCELGDGVRRQRPDIIAFARSMVREDLENLSPLERAARAIDPLMTGLSAPRREIVLGMIANARQPHTSHTHRMLQEMVLGSDEFQRLYGLQPQLETESYLLLYDTSHLDRQTHAAVTAWLAQPNHTAAIITNRPSRPPQGFFGTPEAELGAKLVGLSHVPIAGWGGMSWFSALLGIEPQTIVKPDGVHALAAIQMALGVGVEEALHRAYALRRYAEGRDHWLDLDGAEVLVFEDAPIGLQSGLGAQAALEKVGVRFQLGLHGIAKHPLKREALAAAGGRVHSTLFEALQAGGLIEH